VYSAIFQGIGPTELLIVLAIVLLIFGPKRLPHLGRQLGAGMREFKDSITGRFGDDDADEDRAALTSREPATTDPVEGDVVRERRP
jgi:sec-independent protein translocase protein TatA